MGQLGQIKEHNLDPELIDKINNGGGTTSVEKSDINGNLVINGKETTIYDDSNIMKKEDYVSENNNSNVKVADIAEKIKALADNSDPNVYYGHNGEGIEGAYPFPIGVKDESKIITKEFTNVTEGWEKVIAESLVPLNDKVIISVLKTINNPTNVDITAKEFNIENEININHTDNVYIKDNEISIKNEFTDESILNSDGLMETDLSSYTQIKKCEVR